MTRRARWLPGVAAGVVMLASGACGVDSAPASASGATASVTPVASATASPSPTGPVVPESARVKTVAGAEAFVRFYLELVNEAWTTPKAGLLPPLSDKRCQFCTRTEDDTRTLVRSGTRYASDPVRVGMVEPVLSPPEHAVFEILIVQNATAVIDANGRTVDHVRGARERVRVGAVWTADGWRFLDLESLT